MTAGLRYGVEVRSAQLADAAELARLLSSLGAATTARDMGERLASVRSQATAACFVATGYGGLNGVVAVSWVPTLQDPRPVAHVTAFIVDPEERRRGIGRLLLKAASQAARIGGCDIVRMAVADQGIAEAFCRRTGFLPHGAVFERSLRKIA